MNERTVYVLDDLQSAANDFETLRSVRTYQHGDYATWEALMSRSPGERSFDDEVRKQPWFRPHRVFFALREDRVVGTASAAVNSNVGPHAGWLTLVGPVDHSDIADELSAACRAALSAMVREGREVAWAEPGDARLDAVFEAIGFRKRALTIGGGFADHTDYDKRTVTLRRWHGKRRIGESTGHTGDARGDESLYHPSKLGSASVDPAKVTVDTDVPLTLTYTAGNLSISSGMSVKFWMAGQGSLGTAPQDVDPGYPGYVEVETPRGVSVDLICAPVRVLSLETGEDPAGGLAAGDLVVGPITVGFTINEGRIEPGEKVVLYVGRSSGFRWKRLAGRKEFKVIVEPGSGEPNMRLPEPVVVTIEPGRAERIDVFLPGSTATGGTVQGLVRVKDRFDNRIDHSGVVHLDGCETERVFLNQGAGRFDFIRNASESVSVRAQCDGLEIEGRSNPNVSGTELQLFFGDMHTHDFQSTAEGYPADCYQWARDEKRLDFQALPVQVHRWIDNEKWTIAKHLNEYFLEEGRFVTFLSFEWQHSQYGDKVIHFLGGDMPYLPVDDPRYADPRDLYEALGAADAFIISHHPGYQLDLHVPGTRWETVNTEVDRLAEIWSMHGSSEGFDPSDRPLIPPRRAGGVYEGAKAGLRIGFVGGSDTHTARPGGSFGEPRPYFGGMCAVWARELTRRSLFESFLNRRTYALTGARIALEFAVNGAPMGDEAELADTRHITGRIVAPGEIAHVHVLKNCELFHAFEVGPKEFEIDLKDHDDSPAFYHCRVEQSDGEKAVCSPVWIG